MGIGLTYLLGRKIPQPPQNLACSRYRMGDSAQASSRIGSYPILPFQMVFRDSDFLKYDAVSLPGLRRTSIRWSRAIACWATTASSWSSTRAGFSRSMSSISFKHLLVLAFNEQGNCPATTWRCRCGGAARHRICPSHIPRTGATPPPGQACR